MKRLLPGLNSEPMAPIPRDNRPRSLAEHFTAEKARQQEECSSQQVYLRQLHAPKRELVKHGFQPSFLLLCPSHCSVTITYLVDSANMEGMYRYGARKILCLSCTCIQLGL